MREKYDFLSKEKTNVQVKYSLKMLNNKRFFLIPDISLAFERLSLVQILSNIIELNCTELAQSINSILVKSYSKKKWCKGNSEFCEISLDEQEIIRKAIEVIRKSEINYPLMPIIKKYSNGQYCIVNVVKP